MWSPVKLLVKKTASLVRERNFHLWHKNEAKKILAELERVNGMTDPKLIALSDEYASDVLGWRGYAYWLYVYSAMRNSFQEGWIPANYYRKVVWPTLLGKYGDVSRLRGLTTRLFAAAPEDLFPDKAYLINTFALTPDYRVLNEYALTDILFAKAPIVVFKQDDSHRGKNIFILRKETFNIDKLRSLGSGVFQEYIEQHDFFNNLMPNSVATLRLTTVLNSSGDASVRACYLRLGRIEDTHVRSSSQVRVSVNVRSGELNASGHLPNWVPIKSHPDTNIAFANQVIPFFSECMSVVSNLHKSFPFVRCIGWDTVIDREGCVKMLEWNGHYNDIKYSEATQGPCFADLGWEKLWKVKV